VETEPAQVFPHVAKLEPVPVTGGPVTVPAAAVARVYRLAWFMTSSVHPELRLTGPGVTALAQYFAGAGVPAVEAGALLVRFPAAIGLATLNRMTKLGAEPWTHVPSGTTLEVATRPLKGGNESLGGPGFSRFRGTIDDEGGERVWRITEAFPRVSGDVLRHALALSAAAESDHRLVLADVAEAERVYAAFQRDKYPWNPLTRKGAALYLATPHPQTIHVIAQAGFRSLFSSVWPPALVEDLDDDTDD